jgi:hypothetical protein
MVYQSLAREDMVLDQSLPVRSRCRDSFFAFFERVWFVLPAFDFFER